jgi:hypothetical protein
MRPRGLVAIIGAIAAGLVLASAGAGVAMKLDRGEPTASVIKAFSVDQAKIDEAIEKAKAKLRGQKLLRLLNAGNRGALLVFLKKNYSINPKKVVIQKGARNYAGPKCPGKGWNCTKARQVIQYSLHHDDDDGEPNYNGRNRFACSSSYGGTGSQDNNPNDGQVSCFVIQIRSTPGHNAAACVQETNSRPVVTQTCDIEQFTPKGNNFALIDQSVSRRDTGGEQEVLQKAFLDQSAIEGSNLASIDQDANLLIVGTSASGQEQDAHQLADATLDTETGHNGLNVDQHQDLEERATGSIARQLQNADLDPVVNCAPEGPGAPNSCADIDMTTGTGNNLLDLDQENDLDMTVAGGTVTGSQQQGSCEGGLFETTANPFATGCVAATLPGADGGTEASINMFSFEEGAVKSTATGRALEEMPTNKPGIVQLQFADPGCCFGTFFVGDPANSTINLLANQRATMGLNSYQASENVLGCISGNPDGGPAQCSATLTVTDNDGTSTNSASGQALFAEQDCRGSGTCPAPTITVTTETFPTTTGSP